VTDLPPCHTPPTSSERPGVNCNATLFAQGYLFDERDAINRRNFVSYGFTTRLLGRGPTEAETAARSAEAEAAAATAAPDAAAAPAPFVGPPEPFVGPPAPGEQPAPVKEKPAGPPRELVRASVLHGYDVSRTLVGNSHESDVDLGLRLSPIDYVSMTYTTTVSPELAALRGFTAGMVLRDAGWTPPSPVRNYQTATTALIGYRFVEDSVNLAGRRTPESAALSAAGVNELNGGLYLRLGNYLGLGFFSRFSYNDAPVIGTNGQGVVGPDGKLETIGPHFLERDYLVRLISRCNCWMVEAGVADKFNPDERLFRVQVTLVGLGSYGGLPTRNFIGIAPITGIGVRQPGSGGRAGGVGPGFGGGLY
jgi:hypothetical protein